MSSGADGLIEQLEADLLQIAQLLEEEDADQANLALLAHDQHLRSYLMQPASAIDVSALEQLQRRHTQLLSQMEQAREVAASRLRNQRATRSAVSAYQTSRNY